MDSLRTLAPGCLAAAVIALAASFVAGRYGGSTVLYALLLGMAINFLGDDPRARPGLVVSSSTILRAGVALLGARLSASQVSELGWETMGMVATAVAATLGFGMVLARALRRPVEEAAIATGAVAICGASAAIAIASVAPRNEQTQRFTAVTIVGVTMMSTIAMILYPALTELLALSPEAAGVFLGATIHDVAQVVGAGYLVSPQVGLLATLVKLFRVALLIPVVICFAIAFRAPRSAGRVTPPWFIVAFVGLAVLSTQGLIPANVTDAMSELSRCCFVLAISALGVTTSFRDVASLGWRPVALLVCSTTFLAIACLLGLLLLGRL